MPKKVESLTTIQNGDNDSASEDQCVLDRRVLGALAPFRCMSALSGYPGILSDEAPYHNA